MNRFQELKNELLSLIDKENTPWAYYEIETAENMRQLLAPITRDPHFYIFEVLNPELMIAFKEEFRSEDIYINENASRGTILAFGEDTVIKASGRAKVASRDAIIFATEFAEVIASGGFVSASGDSRITAYSDVIVSITGDAHVDAHDDVLVRADNSKWVECHGFATCWDYFEGKIFNKERVIKWDATLLAKNLF